MILGNLFKVANLIITKGLSVNYALKFLLYSLPTFICLGIPVASLIASLMSLGKMAQDNEIIALQTSGFSFLKIIEPLIIVGIILVLISLILFFQVIPTSLYLQRSTIKRMAKETPQAFFEPGSFINVFKDTLIFVYNVRGNNLYNIFIYKLEGDKTRTIFAPKAKFIITEENKVKLKLMDGVSDEIDPQNPNKFYKLKFKNLFLTLDMKKREKMAKKPKDMTWQEIKNHLNDSPVNIPFKIEFYKRINMSLMPLLFIILGAGLTQKIHIKSKSLNICLGFIIAGLFYILLIFMQGLSIQNKIAPFWGLSIPSLIFGILGVYLLFKDDISRTLYSYKLD